MGGAAVRVEQSCVGALMWYDAVCERCMNGSYYGSADGGCVAAGGVVPLLLAVVSPTLYLDEHFRYWVPSVEGGLSSKDGYFFTDTSWSFSPTTRPWYKVGQAGGGVVAPFSVEAVSSSIVARSYALPVWSSGGTLAGVVTAGIRRGSEVGCTSACETNSGEARVALAAAAAVTGDNATYIGTTTRAGLAAAAKGLYLSFVSVRSSVRSPGMGLGVNATGAYVEVVSCAFYGSSDSGCNAAPGGTANVVALVSKGVFGHKDIVYYLVDSEGVIDVDGPPLVVSPGPYDPRSRGWWSAGVASNGGFGTPFEYVGLAPGAPPIVGTTYTVPVYMGSPSYPWLFGVVFSSVSLGSNPSSTYVVGTVARV